MFNKLRARMAERLNSQYPTVALSADRTTGHLPMHLGEVAEHTEQYLALKSGAETTKGMLTGILGGAIGLSLLSVSLLFLFRGNMEWLLNLLASAAAAFLVPLSVELIIPLTLPTVFNRRTREVYFELNGELYHTPWDQIAALTYEYQMVHQNTGVMRHAPLEVLMHCYGKPEQAIFVNMVIPVGRSVEINQHFWEYLRALMNNGPWFDNNGNPSASDQLVRGQLASALKPSDYLAHSVRTIATEKKANGGKNYLSGIDTALLLGDLFFYPMHRIQQLTYDIAKRRSRNDWPPEVTERLQADGPTTRLIDLERERGLNV